MQRVDISSVSFITIFDALLKEFTERFNDLTNIVMEKEV